MTEDRIAALLGGLTEQVKGLSRQIETVDTDAKTHRGNVATDIRCILEVQRKQVTEDALRDVRVDGHEKRIEDVERVASKVSSVWGKATGAALVLGGLWMVAQEKIIAVIKAAVNL